MALSYDDANTGVFTHLGKIVKNFDLQPTYATLVETMRDEIIDVFEAGDVNVAIDGFASDCESMVSEHVARRATLANFALRRLQDRTTVLNEIGAVSSSQAEIIHKLIARMILDSESVDASTVTLGSTTAVSGNVGNGTIVSTKILDGYTSPGTVSGGQVASHPEYRGVNSELAVTETMSFRVTADSFSDGLAEGAETIQWQGGVAGEKYGFFEGSGSTLPTLTPINAESIVSNGDFETFANNVPEGWTLVSGTGGTHVRQETTAADVYHGDSALRFDGDNSQATISVSYTMDRTQIRANKMYAVSVRIKASGASPSAALTIRFEGTGYSEGSTEKITIADGAHPTSYTLYTFFVIMPATIPEDFKLVISWASTPAASTKLWLDDLAFGPVVYGGGVGVIAVRGSTPFVRDDRFTIAVSNNEAGLFQRFFRRVFGCQLPSNAAASETIDDALAA